MKRNLRSNESKKTKTMKYTNNNPISNITNHKICDDCLDMDDDSPYFIDDPYNEIHHLHIYADIFYFLKDLHERVTKLEESRESDDYLHSEEIEDMKTHIDFLEDNLRTLRYSITE